MAGVNVCDVKGRVKSDKLTIIYKKAENIDLFWLFPHKWKSLSSSRSCQCSSLLTDEGKSTRMENKCKLIIL